jgi:hypothetical protein
MASFIFKIGRHYFEFASCSHLSLDESAQHEEYSVRFLALQVHNTELQ